jgi:DNA-directed RNA polymerase sigma subunit (sigma70/sigma32)
VARRRHLHPDRRRLRDDSDVPLEPPDDYQRRVETFPQFTEVEESALAVAANAGDQTAYKRLIEANLRLVIPIAHRYEGDAPFRHLIEEGNGGLVRAVRLFAPAEGRSFSAVAETLIEEAIAGAH